MLFVQTSAQATERSHSDERALDYNHYSTCHPEGAAGCFSFTQNAQATEESHPNGAKLLSTTLPLSIQQKQFPLVVLSQHNRII
jgi:hypothetical protein